MLDKATILAAKDLPVETVEVPEWGGSVCVRTLTGTERDAFEAQYVERGKRRALVNIRARLAALCMVDDKGVRLFTDAEAVELGKKSGQALDRVFTAAQRLNGWSATEIEELAKNSDSGQNDDSISN